jgi:hypothetical protein
MADQLRGKRIAFLVDNEGDSGLGEFAEGVHAEQREKTQA